MLSAGSKQLDAQKVSTSASATVGVPEVIGGMSQITSSVQLPPAASSGINHIVVVTMENRSFDHFLGWLPGATGSQAGLTYLDKNNVPHPTHELAPDFEGCGHNDPDHSYAGSRTAYNNGAMNGFLKAGNNDIFSIGYYTERDIPFYAALARNFLVCDQYFASFLGPTFPNRIFLWAAQSDRQGDTVELSGLTTIFDRLHSAGVSHQYYFNNLPFLAFWGLKYIFSTSLYSNFLNDAASGKLPAVSYVDPRYTILDDGTGNDDHPHADIRNGEAFLSQIYNAVTKGPGWPNTVLIITFDEWGGLFETVAPPRAIAPNKTDPPDASGNVLLGFRVPAVVVSPFTQNTTGVPSVTHTLFDHTSILKLIEWRFGLAPLTARDSSTEIGNLATSMSFKNPDPVAPVLPATKTVFAAPCFGGGIFSAAAKGTASAVGNKMGATEWAPFSAAPHVQEWLHHPRFRDQLSAKPQE